MGWSWEANLAMEEEEEETTVINTKIKIIQKQLVQISISIHQNSRKKNFNKTQWKKSVVVWWKKCVLSQDLGFKET